MADELTVDNIIELSQMQLGDDAIVAKIKSSGSHFDLSTDQMIDLKRRGVSSAVIAAMVNTSVVDTAAEMSPTSPDPKTPHPAGVYLLHGDTKTGKMERLDPTSASQAKTGGIWGYALTGGIASASMKVSIPGASARVVSTTKPYFYFFFDQAGQGAAAASFLGATYFASSPAEFNLVRLDSKRNRREAKVGSINLGGMKTGVMDKDRIPIVYEMVRPGVYQVKAGGILEPGEYGFLYSVAGGTAGAAGSRIFDFSVR